LLEIKQLQRITDPAELKEIAHRLPHKLQVQRNQSPITICSY
jgi:hypothetical protein